MSNFFSSNWTEGESLHIPPPTLPPSQPGSCTDNTVGSFSLSICWWWLESPLSKTKCLLFALLLSVGPSGVQLVALPHGKRHCERRLGWGLPTRSCPWAGLGGAFLPLSGGRVCLLSPWELGREDCCKGKSHLWDPFLVRGERGVLICLFSFLFLWAHECVPELK